MPILGYPLVFFTLSIYHYSAGQLYLVRWIELALCIFPNSLKIFKKIFINGSLEVTQTSLVDKQSLETLVTLSANLEKVAGMIRQTIIVSKEFAGLTPLGKEQLEYQMRNLRKLHAQLQTLVEEIHGNL